MSEQVYVVALVVIGLCCLGLVALAIVALCLGRPLRAAGRVRLGPQHEFSLGLEVDVPPPSNIRAKTAPQTIAVLAPRCQSVIKQLEPPSNGVIKRGPSSFGVV